MEAVKRYREMSNGAGSVSSSSSSSRVEGGGNTNTSDRVKNVKVSLDVENVDTSKFEITNGYLISKTKRLLDSDEAGIFYDEMVRSRRGLPVNDFAESTGGVITPEILDRYIDYRSAFVRNNTAQLSIYLDEIKAKQAKGTYVHDWNTREGQDGADPLDMRDSGTFFITTNHKLKHDIEQLQYLIDTGTLPPTAKLLNILEGYKELYASKMEGSGNLAEMNIFGVDIYLKMGHFYNTLFYIHPAPMVNVALNPSINYSELEDRYFSKYPELIHFDNFLTPEAMQGLIEWTLRSTMYYDNKKSYLGAYMDDGFYSPLLMQVAEEMRQRMPRIFGVHALAQAWAYKYENSMEGIKLHADQAAVNVNFWIAPDEANLDPTSGGLEVYTVEAPMEWAFGAYNFESSVPNIMKFLVETKAERVVIPHRQNRVVIFNSNLFHSSDHHGRFDDSQYRYRRINLTLLFGERQPVRNRAV